MTEAMILLVFNSLAHVSVLRALNLWTLWGNFCVYVNLDFSMILNCMGAMTTGQTVEGCFDTLRLILHEFMY